MAKLLFFSITALGFFCNITFAFGPIPLQDLCVADPTSSTRLNGLPCKDPATVKAEDFFFSGLHIPGNTKNPYGAALTSMTVAQVPGLNTLGLSLARLDLAPDGFVPPHSHPRATEILTVLEGSLEVGFITSYPDNKHLSKVLNQGDAFVIPVGLVHYQRNVAGKRNTVVLAAVNSQNAGITVVPKGIFGAKPAINSDYLARAFLLNKNIVEQLQARF
ncbi:putative germin-like protein 2-1 [Sesamum alatum]|uniref:Germin-like protein n=1 Tax=Sesamum alatum TaxID=300844 RepID=A0AAE1XJB5_9LAMI|nr:putative germin-like protein 2-1 [Sesamum alatum]